MVWLELVSRELLFASFCAASGAAPARALSTRFGTALRVALAPVLGLCVLVAFFTTVEWFFAGGDVAFLAPVVALCSLGVGCWPRRRRRLRLPTRRELLAAAWLALIAIAVALPATSALAAHNSVGPMSYEVYDGPGYVANADGAQSLSISRAASLEHVDTADENYVDRWWIAEAADSTRLDDAPVVAALDGLVGLQGTETYASDLIALIVIGALAMFASIRFACRRTTPFASLGALAFGGSFFLQLLFDGSQAALNGLVVVVPLFVLGFAAFERRSLASLVLVALVLSDLAAVYPIFLLPILVATGIFAVLGAIATRRALAGRLVRELCSWAAMALLVLVLAAMFDLVAAVRDVTSISSLLAGGGILSSFPQYHLGAGVVASWLLQTRDLYGVAFGPQSPFYDLVPALLIPVAVVVTAVAGLRRRPVAWFALLVVACACTIAAYETVRNGCGYCEDRSLLSSVPPLVLLIFTGLGSLCSSGRLLVKAAVVAISALYVSFGAYDLVNARATYEDGSYVVPSSLRTLVATIPRTRRGVEIEGFNALSGAMAADTYGYELLFEHDPAVSAATASSSTGLAEDWGPKPLTSAYFRPNYAYVLSALPGVSSGRQRLGAVRGAVLERRAEPLEVTIEAGVRLVAPERVPEVVAPLVFVVTGSVTGHSVVRARLIGPASALAASAAAASQGERLAVHGDELSACVPVSGGKAIRTATLALASGAGLELTAMRAATGRC